MSFQGRLNTELVKSTFKNLSGHDIYKGHNDFCGRECRPELQTSCGLYDTFLKDAN